LLRIYAKGRRVLQGREALPPGRALPGVSHLGDFGGGAGVLAELLANVRTNRRTKLAFAEWALLIVGPNALRDHRMGGVIQALEQVAAGVGEESVPLVDKLFQLSLLFLRGGRVMRGQSLQSRDRRDRLFELAALFPTFRCPDDGLRLLEVDLPKSPAGKVRPEQFNFPQGARHVGRRILEPADVVELPSGNILVARPEGGQDLLCAPLRLGYRSRQDPDLQIGVQ